MAADTTLTRADGSVCATIKPDDDGTLMLRAERVLMVDLPASNVAGQATQGLLRQVFWFLRAGPLQDRREMSQAERDLIARVTASLATRPTWNIRVYRTVGGMRLLATHAQFDAAGSDAQGFMREIGAPEQYMEQCRHDRQFRARVGPPESKQRGGAKPFATCHILKSLRDPNADVAHDPEAMLVGEWHDRATRAASELPLA